MPTDQALALDIQTPAEFHFGPKAREPWWSLGGTLTFGGTLAPKLLLLGKNL